MNLDDRLDALLTASGQPVSPLPDDDDAHALAPLLAAAVRLAPLREAQPSARFADQLERQMLAHAAARAARLPDAPPHAVAPESGDLDRYMPTLPMPVVNGTDADPAQLGVTPPSGSRATRREPLPAHARGARRRGALPLWARALAAACVLLALGSGLFAAAANAQPGSPLFGLHRAEQWARVSLASPDDKARLHLQYANDALAALDRAVAQHSGDPAYGGALSSLQSELAAAASAIASLPAGQTHDTFAGQLAALQQRARDDLRAALPGLSWGDRLATTTALGGLGESVPHVSGAVIHEVVGQGAHDGGQGSQGGTAHGGQSVQIVVSGTGFAAGAKLVLDGQPAGTVLSVTGDTLVAQVSLEQGGGRVDSIGVENPDGTAAQTSAIDHGAAIVPPPAAGPQVTPTPTGHGGHGGGHGGGGGGNG